MYPHGEFGWFIQYIRFVYSHKCNEKVVCCRRGDELFFPNANRFLYDFPDCDIPDENRQGTYISQQECQFKIILEKQYPEFFIYHPGLYYNHKIFYHTLAVPLVPKIIRGIKCEIVLGPRQRKRRHRKNLPYWQGVVDKLISDGISVGVTGRKDTTFNLKGVINSWDYEDNHSSSIEMLQNCKVFCSAATGTAALAANCNVPMLLLVQNRLDWAPIYKLWNKDIIMSIPFTSTVMASLTSQKLYDALIQFYRDVCDGKAGSMTYGGEEIAKLWEAEWEIQRPFI